MNTLALAGPRKVSNRTVAEAAYPHQETAAAVFKDLATLFHNQAIDTQKVLNAAGTKWQFLPVRRRVAGGHCISVDPEHHTWAIIDGQL